MVVRKDRKAKDNDACFYIGLVAAVIAGGCLFFVMTLQVLALHERKPPPGFVNSICSDAKLEFLRENPPIRPTHLIAGSSIGWRNIAGEVIAARFPKAQPLNAGFCGLQVNQSGFVTRYFLERYSSITDVLLILNPEDMSACAPTKDKIFNPRDVDAYLAGANDLIFYFRYFDLFSLLRNATGLKERRTRNTSLDPLLFTPYGDGPLSTDASRGIFYDEAPRFDSTCQHALRALAKDVTRSGRRFLVVTMPLLAAWSKRFDPDGQIRTSLAQRIRAALHDTPSTFWDAWSEIELASSGYTDAYHLRWSEAQTFTARLVEATGFGSGSI